MKKIMLMVAVAVVAGAQAAASTEVTPPKAKKFIAIGWEFRNLKPADVLAHADRFASLPIDGVCIVVSAKDPETGRNYSQIGITDYPAWKWEAFADQVPVLRKLVAKPHLQDSFLGGYCAPIHRSAWTDDKAWAMIENNMGVVARLAHEAGMKGITIDHEDYRQQRQYFRDEGDPPYDECCRLARARGRQVFGRVWREHPSAILLSFWVLSETRPYFVTRDPAALMRQKGDLWPAFVAGILDAMPPTGRLIDGDEHGYRHEHSLNEFHVASANVRKWGALLLPEDVRGKYAARVEQGFGQYLDYYTHPYTPGKRAMWSVGPEGGSRLEHFRRNIQAASDLADEYVWLWGEKHPWIVWDGKARNSNKGVQYESTWEQELPGLCEMLSVVKGGEAAEAEHLARLIAQGAVTNAIAGMRMRMWQTGGKDKKGNPLPQGTFRVLDGGVHECEGLQYGTFYCYLRGLMPGDRYAVRLRARGKNVLASLVWGDAEGSFYRLPATEFVFGAPDADGWREAAAFLTVPPKADDFQFVFGATRQKPGEKAQFRDMAAYRIWPVGKP